MPESNQNSSYTAPPINLLRTDSYYEPNQKQNYLENLFEQFGVNIQISGVYEGYGVTRYDARPKPGTRLSEIYDMKFDLEYQLQAGPIRIEVATPDDPIIGIEVPTGKFERFPIRQMIESKEFITATSGFPIAIGANQRGRTVIADLNLMPHLLISGSTGTGKTMFINSLIISTIYKSSPEDVQFIIVDPKSIDLRAYNGIPYLPVRTITKPKAASGMLKWAVSEMERRYRLFTDNEVRNIDEFNQYKMKQTISEGEPTSYTSTKLPHIVIIVDEFADLIVSGEEIEEPICRLAQLARNVGIHLIIATQRPSCDVLTGLIKANIPNRIGFKVATEEDSITIIDQKGAECLLGTGDMLYFPHDLSKPLRLQGAFVSKDEVDSAVGYLKEIPHNTVFKNPLEEAEGFKDLMKEIEDIETGMQSLSF